MNKVKELFNKSGWSLYRLSKESGISASILYEFLVTERIKSLSDNNSMEYNLIRCIPWSSLIIYIII